MTKQRDPKITIQEMILAARACQEFVFGFNFEAFEKDLKTKSAVQHQLLIIGEAVKRLPSEVKNLAPKIPWKEIAGTRDILIHCYEEADYQIIWNIVTNQLKGLLVELEALLSTYK